jgi:hypothetical protein
MNKPSLAIDLAETLLFLVADRVKVSLAEVAVYPVSFTFR